MIIKPKKPIYLDHQASTPMRAEVLEVMKPYFLQEYGNPHSGDHFFGWQAKKAVDVARRKIADFVQADADEIVFTSGATEANNLAISGSLPHMRASGKKKIIVSAFEHKCVLECVRAAEKEGFSVVYLNPTREGFIDPSSLAQEIDDSVGLVSIMMVNNEIGTIQPIKKLAEIAHKHGALFHTDAAQAASFLEIDSVSLDVDMISLSAHKIYGPKGIGALFIRRPAQDKISPIIHGGGQENNFRSGTLPVMLCAGFGEACALAKQYRSQYVAHVKECSETFLNSLRSCYPNVGLNGATRDRHPGNLNILFPHTDAHSLLQGLQPHVAASTGSACTTGTPEASYALRALGLSEIEARSSVRFSFGWENDVQQVDESVDLIITSLNMRDRQAVI